MPRPRRSARLGAGNDQDSATNIEQLAESRSKEATAKSTKRKAASSGHSKSRRTRDTSTTARQRSTRSSSQGKSNDSSATVTDPSPSEVIDKFYKKYTRKQGTSDEQRHPAQRNTLEQKPAKACSNDSFAFPDDADEIRDQSSFAVPKQVSLSPGRTADTTPSSRSMRSRKVSFSPKVVLHSTPARTGSSPVQDSHPLSSISLASEDSMSMSNPAQHGMDVDSQRTSSPLINVTNRAEKRKGDSLSRKRKVHKLSRKEWEKQRQEELARQRHLIDDIDSFELAVE